MSKSTISTFAAGNGEHGGVMCYNSPIYGELNPIADVVLAYKPKPKSKAGKKRKRKEAKLGKSS